MEDLCLQLQIEVEPEDDNEHGELAERDEQIGHDLLGHCNGPKEALGVQAQQSVEEDELDHEPARKDRHFVLAEGLVVRLRVQLLVEATDAEVVDS